MQFKPKKFFKNIQKKNEILSKINAKLYSNQNLYNFKLNNVTKDLSILPLTEFDDLKIQKTQNKNQPSNLTVNLLEDLSESFEDIDTKPPCTITDIQQNSPQITYNHIDFKTVALYDELIKRELFLNIQKQFSEHDCIDPDKLTTSDYTYPLRQTVFKNKRSILSKIPDFYRPINITFLTIIKSKNTFYILAGKRPKNIYQNSGYNSLIPTGICRESLIKEQNKLLEKYAHLYTQEVFDNKNPSTVDPHVQGIVDILKSSGTTFKKTGQGINLNTMRLEITGLCIIRAENYLETVTKNKVENGIKTEQLSLLPLSKIDTNLDIILETFSNSDLFALNNGIDNLR